MAKKFTWPPVRGKGLWDAIWGFIAMDENMTIQGVYFDHKGETPGLGAEIKQRFFMMISLERAFLKMEISEVLWLQKGIMTQKTQINQIKRLMP